MPITTLRGLRLPRFVLRLRFGRAAGVSRSNDELVGEYLDKLEEQQIDAEKNVDRKKYAMLAYGRAVYFMRRYLGRIREGGVLPSMSRAGRLVPRRAFETRRNATRKPDGAEHGVGRLAALQAGLGSSRPTSDVAPCGCAEVTGQLEEADPYEDRHQRPEEQPAAQRKRKPTQDQPGAQHETPAEVDADRAREAQAG